VIDVLLVDDEAMVREGFRMILETEPDIRVAGEAADGREALRQTAELHPDVVLMDIRMPELDGLEATRRLVANGSARVLVLTTFDNDEYVYEALKSGASGFMLKSAPRDQLITAVRVVAAGEQLLAPGITRRLIEEYVRRPAPGATRPAALRDLSERELDVLRLIARGRSNQEIAAELFIGEATVKTHIGRIFAKLGLRDRAQAVVAAYEAGLVRIGETGEASGAGG
jgi:DNA-binding NarL/FixJ family response regulator